MITAISRRSRRHPWVAAPTTGVEPSSVQVASEEPAEAASACSEFLTPDDKPTRRWIDRALDFGACCVLALAMAWMEEPQRGDAQLARGLALAVISVASLALLLWSSKP